MNLAEVIALTFAYYHRGESLQDAVLKMYVADLADLDAGECIKAYELYRRDPKNRSFPLPAQIRELVKPGEFISNEETARVIAARIVGAVTKYGWNNARDAEGFVGPVGWAAVLQQGGWSHICENMGLRISPTTFQAQIRDLLEANLKHGAHAIDAKIKQIPERRTPAQLEKPNWTNRLLGERDED